MTIKVSKFGGTFHEESATYPFGTLISDVCGALGLVLGLSILDFVVFSSNFMGKAVYWLFNRVGWRSGYKLVSFGQKNLANF